MIEKNICYNVAPLNMDEDFKVLKASDGIYTSKLIDPCGNERIFLGCNPDECGTCGEEEPCCSVPTTIYGNLLVTKGENGTACGDGNICANNIEAVKLKGDGSEVENTDDTKITSFLYNSIENQIELTQFNHNVPDSEETFTIQMDDFTKDTKVTYFDFDQLNSNILTLKDNDGGKWQVDLSKYDDKDDETYIVDGSCDAYGNIQLWYNKPDMRKINIDISNAITNLDKYVTGGYLNNTTLVLNRKDDIPIKINLYGLISGIVCQEDIYVECAEWCGNDLILKRNDGVDIIISFTHLLDQLIDEINPIVSGCVTEDNEIILFKKDKSEIKVGKVHTTDTKLENAIWKINPQYPDDPSKLTLRLKNSDNSEVDIRFGELVSRMPCDNTYVVDGRIVKDKDGYSDIILVQNNGEKITIKGLINRDTIITDGYYDYTNQSIVLNNNFNQKVRVDIQKLIEQCTNQADKYLTNFKWVGNDVLQLIVEGAPNLLIPFSKFRNIDQSIKEIKYVEESGQLTIFDQQNKQVSTYLLKRGDIKNITQCQIVEDFLYIKREDGKTWTLKLPNSYITEGIYNNGGNENSKSPFITLKHNNELIDNVIINGVENTFVTDLKVYDDTLRLSQNNGSKINVKLTPILNIAKDISTLVNGEYDKNTGEISLNYPDGECITIEGLPLNTTTKGQVTLGYNSWNGKVDYYIDAKNIMVNIDIEIGTSPSDIIGSIPVTLPFEVTKYLTGLNKNGTLWETIQIPIKISVNGDISLSESIPDKIKDSFTLITL